MPDDPLFPESALLRQAGRAVFDRGARYAAQDAVDILSIRPRSVRARVFGSEVYAVEVVPPGDRASCTCPAFEREGYCKHIVAAALRANREPAQGEEEPPEPDVRTHLVSLGAEALADRLIRIADLDGDLRRDLHMEASLAAGDGEEILATLRRALEDATADAMAGATYFDDGAGPARVSSVEAVLDRIESLVESPHAPVALTLATEALDLLAARYEELDDHEGTAGSLRRRAAEIHRQAALRAAPDPLALARWLFEEETRSDLGTFRDASVTYADVLGEPGLAEFRRLAEATLAAGDASRDVVRVIDVLHERDGNVDARIALRRERLDDLDAYEDLVRFCVGAGRREEALEYAEEGLWRFEDARPNERLVLLCAELLRESGRADDALSRLEAAFARQPSPSLYGEIRDRGGEPARERALAVLDARAAKERHRVPLWGAARDMLVAALAEDGRMDSAWEARDRHGCSDGVAERLARASDTTHTERALAVYAERVEQLAASGSSGAYAEAAALVTRMASLRPQAEHDAYLAGLRTRWKRRRNLMALIA